VTQPSDDVKGTWLPQEAFDRLQAEYDDRTGPLRTEITKRIEAAREEGDLKENGGYHAAKEEQGKNEARIRQLRQLLENAQVGEAPPDDGVAEAGMVVTVRFAGDDETETFLLGHREANASSDIEVYSPTSPLGAALLGAKVGDTVEYTMPNGRKAKVDLVDAKPFTG
jgi:transcription elongation factor GreA